MSTWIHITVEHGSSLESVAPEMLLVWDQRWRSNQDQELPSPPFFKNYLDFSYSIYSVIAQVYFLYIWRSKCCFKAVSKNSTRCQRLSGIKILCIVYFFFHKIVFLTWDFILLRQGFSFNTDAMSSFIGLLKKGSAHGNKRALRSFQGYRSTHRYKRWWRK